MILVTTFYNNEISDKLKDATDALVNNLRNKYITKIVVLTDGLNNRFLQHNKITIVKVSVDFDNIIEWISKTYKSGEYVVSKPFVKYDISLSKIRNINLTDKLIVIPSIGNPGSTDSFIFNLPIDFSKYEIFKDKGIEVSSKYPYYSSNYKNLNKLVIENKQEQPIQQVTIQPHVLQNRKLVREELVPNVRRVNKRFAQPPVVIKREKSNQSTPEGYHRNHKIDIIIVSVNYNDFLAITLKQNKKFGRVTVATTSDDLMCHQICQKYGVNYIISDRVYENGAKFNKGKIINDVINSLDSPEWILHLDADIILPDNFLEVVNSITLDSNTLYGTKRAICRDYETYKLYKSGVLIYNQIGNIEQASGFGFFQMFNMNNDRLGRPIYPEMSGDASWSDLVFRDKFTKRATIELDVIHLGDAYQNWTGRRTDRFITDDVMNDLVNKKSSYKIVTTYYNYRDDVRVKNNFIKFMQQFSGYDMIVGYIDDGNIDFEIPFKTVVIKSNEKKWWKEILLNKILDNVEDDYFIWIDNDLIYEDLGWLNNLDEIMNGKDFLQLFSKINYLGESGEILESYNSIMSANPTKDNIDNLLGGGYKPGGSWCGRTSILKEKKFYDGMVVGGGDTIFLYGLFGITNGWTLGKVKENNFNIWRFSMKWISEFGKYNVGFIDCAINHLWHGDLNSRMYNDRYSKLKSIKSKNKRVLYTCIVGEYDKLKEINNVEYDIDYICFTDQIVSSETWEVREIPKILTELDVVKRSRCMKILPNLFLDEYEDSIWIDGSIEVMGDINEMVNLYLKNYFAIPRHPDRICVYDEAEAVVRLNKDQFDVVDNQINIYKSKNYPKNNGMVQSGVIIRKHNSFESKKICEKWWGEVLKNSKRDQLSFNYSIWNMDVVIDIIIPSIISSKYLRIWSHSKNGSFITNLRSNYDDMKNYINGVLV